MHGQVEKNALTTAYKEGHMLCHPYFKGVAPQLEGPLTLEFEKMYTTTA
jgi:hypothetical protein